jgi:DNA-binding IclR family transcriptional regulator
MAEHARRKRSGSGTQVDESRGAHDADGGHRAARRALEIVECVAAASPTPTTLAELSRRIGMPKSSAHALVRTLDDEGYLERGSGGYVVGQRLLRLLGTVPDQLQRARPIMQSLVDDVGETAILGVRRNFNIVYVEEVEAPQFIRYVAPLGETRPLHCTSIGKIYLAAMPVDAASELLQRSQRRSFTVYTRTETEAIMAEMDAIRTQGFALNREESMPGVIGLGVPVREAGDSDGRLIAGLAIAGPAERLRAVLETAPQRLKEAAYQIGAELSAPEV